MAGSFPAREPEKAVPLPHEEGGSASAEATVLRTSLPLVLACMKHLPALRQSCTQEEG